MKVKNNLAGVIHFSEDNFVLEGFAEIEIENKTKAMIEAEKKGLIKIITKVSHSKKQKIEAKTDVGVLLQSDKEIPVNE